jgi:hypothetical protein
MFGALLLSAALSSGAIAQIEPAPGKAPAADIEVKTDVPARVEVPPSNVPTTESASSRPYLVIGLSTAAVLGLLMLIVLLARTSGDRHTELRHHHT